jgi:predicted aconitase with swiveling domain
MTTDKFVLKGRKIVTGKASGEAIVTKEAISFNGGVDNMTGTLRSLVMNWKGSI